MWTDKNRPFQKCGQTDDVKGVSADGGALSKLTVVNTDRKKALSQAVSLCIRISKWV